jgi:hypothetical protein
MTDEPEYADVQERVEKDAAFRDRLCDWLRLNDIEPNHVPAYERPTYADGKLTLRMRLLDANGKPQYTPAGDGLLEHTVTLPVEVPPTDDVLLWLAPRCPTCGR